MCDRTKSSVGWLVGGVALGAVIGAGATLLFGTKKGKELQSKIKKQYPEVMEKIEDTLSEVKENFDDKVEDIKDGLQKELKPLKKRFVKNGRKL